MLCHDVWAMEVGLDSWTWALAMTQWAMEVGHRPWHDGPHIKLGSLFVHLFDIKNYHWSSSTRSITLCRFITVSCGTVNILRNISISSLNVGIFSRILLIPRNIVMDLNNVMRCMDSTVFWEACSLLVISLQLVGM